MSSAAGHRWPSAAEGLGGLALWLALGLHGHLLGLLFRIIPMLGRFAYPEKYMALVATVLVPMVALGYDRTQRSPRRVLVIGGILVSGLAAFAGTVWFADLSGHAFHRADPTIYLAGAISREIHNAWAGGAVITGAFLGGTLAIVGLSGRYPTLLKWIVVLGFLELWRADNGQLPLASRQILEQPPVFAKAIMATAVPGQPIPRVVSTGGPAGRAESEGMLKGPDGWLLGLAVGLKPELPAIWGIGTIGEAMLPALPARMLQIAGPTPSGWGSWLRACWRVGDIGSTSPTDEKVVAKDESLGVALFAQRCFGYSFIAGALPARDYSDAEDLT